MSLEIRQATSDDLVDIMRLFDGALLATDSDRIDDQLTGSRGCILVAEDTRPVGAIALWSGSVADRPSAYEQAVQITAVAVDSQRRRQGVGRRLIAAAGEWASPQPLSATFDERVREFYAACGFEIDDRESRLWAIRSARVD